MSSIYLTQIDFGTLLLLILIIMLVISLLPNLLKGEEKEKRQQPTKIYSVLSCLECDYSETREFVPGDYVGKILENRKCPKCDSLMYVKAIYAVYEEKTKEKVRI
ncbi:MAG: hypothetical protein ACP5GI_04265 [Sulfolobales archaeon]